MDCSGDNIVTAGIPVPCGMAGVCFQLTSYCTRHLNNSIKINYHDTITQNLELSIVKTFANYFPRLYEDLTL